VAAYTFALKTPLKNKTLPGLPAQNPDPRTTDDRFVMELRLSENTSMSEEELLVLLQTTGYVELDQKELS